MNLQNSQTELIINTKGSIYHLDLKKEDLCNNIILVGDPSRVELFGNLLDSIRFKTQNREYHTITGFLNGKELSIISTGIGVGNIDIVMNELDAVWNIDFKSKTPNQVLNSLNILRIGTCGTVQKDIAPGSALISEFAIGLDNLFTYYPTLPLPQEYNDLHKSIKDLIQNDFYFTLGNISLLSKISSSYKKGITLVAQGFYGPQQRNLRLIQDNNIDIDKLAKFNFNGLQFLNIEMETSLIYGFASLLGHNAIAVDMVLANRATGEFLSEYKNKMEILFLDLVELLFEKN